MVSLKTLKKRGIDQDSLKRKFGDLTYPLSGASVTDDDSETDRVMRLANRIRFRVRDGIDNNFQTYKLFYAIDQAWEVPFRQISPTLARALEEGNYNQTALLSQAETFKLTHMLTDEIDPKTEKPTGRKKLNLPIFFRIFVPLVRSYVIIRAAKLTRDRDLYPLFKYDPIKSDALNRARCEIITDRVEAIVNQMGLRDIMRQVFLNTLLYGQQLMFPQEQWWEERQLDCEGKEFLVREGLRYHLPHPTRTYRDMAHPLSSLNTGTGCKFAGYWRVHRFRDVKNMGLWNTDRIAFATNDYRTKNENFFNAVYSTCAMQFPQATAAWQSMDRETGVQTQFYTSHFDDAGVVVAEHFEEINPKKDGLGDYDYPVWFRFVTAGDGTILYASPLPEKAVIASQYDPDESRTWNASLALEVLPFQDQVSNLLTQALLSVRQNLANITFVDEDMVSPQDLKKIENPGEGLLRSLNFLRFSGRKNRQAQQDVRYAFGSVRLSQLDVPSLFNAINVVLGLLERSLVMSAQEIAGQATHEQSKEEILNIKDSTSNRLAYTSMALDRACEAWKNQLYAYDMELGSPEIFANLSQDPEYTDEVLGMLGFAVAHRSKKFGGKHFVEGKDGCRAHLQVEYFANSRDGASRVNNTTLAQAMLQMLGSALQQPMIAQAIGPDQTIMLINQVIEQMGLPEDFKLQPMPQGGGGMEQQQQWVQAQLQQMAQQFAEFVKKGDQETIKQVAQELKPLAKAIQDATEEGRDNKLAISNLLGIVTGMAAKQQPTKTTNGAPRLTIGGTS